MTTSSSANGTMDEKVVARINGIIDGFQFDINGDVQQVITIYRCIRDILIPDIDHDANDDIPF
jgi:hypothetical protein